MVLAANLNHLFSTTQLFSLGAPSPVAGTRVPHVFTSTLRQRMAKTTSLRASGLTENAISNSLDALPAEYVATLPRSLWPEIRMSVNANSVKFRQGKRIVKKDTREGSVFFHFANTRGQNNDILYATFSGRTGNINPQAIAAGREPTTGAADTTGALRKHRTFHQLWHWTRESKLLPDGTVNVKSILYTSKVIPVTLALHGHCNAALEWSEEGAKPNSAPYSFEFTVQDTDPPLDDLLDYIDEAIELLASGDLSVAQGARVAGVNVDV